ncbi:hypothetical protein [Methylobacterium sp. Leaf89]|uniref:hypothetical protein n=1 Tax=Methylobacterium sp. Leaf89 TaxID=1736245 RepID=UPI0006F4179C|nr:hypothetical protein [Methylobacterium sp. Leaf89]KQO73447.1 hypothetical protein ASF18_16780 [Methylobacterium sp. Leaf89]
MSTPANTTDTTFGRIGPDDALKAIKAENRRAGVTMSYSDEIATAYQLAGALRLDPTTGRTLVVDDAGNTRTKGQGTETADLSAAEFITLLQVGVASSSRSKSSPVPVSGGANRTERAIATNAAKRSPRSEAKAAQAADLVREYGNPWAPHSINRTRQNVVQNLDPALAEQLRNTAGH